MTPVQIITEWRTCSSLRQADAARLISAGVPLMALAGDAHGGGFCIVRDKIVPDPAGHRFEFQRYAETAGEGVCAFIVLALGQDGSLLDLVAFHGGPAPFVGSWLGRCGVLGAENLDSARDTLTVHADPMAWLRAEREGICVVDAVQAAPLLRDAGTMEVGSHSERRRLLDLMAVRLPRVLVRAEDRRVAA